MSGSTAVKTQNTYTSDCRARDDAQDPVAGSQALVSGMLKTSVLFRFCAQDCRYAVNFTSTFTPFGVVRSYGSHSTLASRSGPPSARPTKYSARKPRSALSRVWEYAHLQNPSRLPRGTPCSSRICSSPDFGGWAIASW